MKYADQINGLNADISAQKYELFWTVANEVYALVDMVFNLISGAI